ncbi:MAG: hypothetical protein GEU82_16410 [Luteitalea sp.]|nr:hypothetical protein [Luteitalea sp.]
MLALNLQTIKSGRERFERVYPADVVYSRNDDFKIVAPVELGFDIYKDKDQYRLVGKVATSLELNCSRCLEPFVAATETAFDLRYQRHTPVTNPVEREVEEDDLTTAFYENEEIDLGQLMHEQFYLALPMKPLCEEACKGLCSTCGTNLNRGGCQCHPRWNDPRLAVLEALKKES